MADTNETKYGAFPETRWSLVDCLHQGDDVQRAKTLDALLRAYMPALRAHLVRGRGLSPPDAEDVMQDFIARRILDKDILQRANRELGRFRTFLLASLDRFVIDWRRHGQAKKRSPGAGRLVELSDVESELRTRQTAAEHFDQAWARQVVGQAIARMNTQCTTTEREDLWRVFECRVLAPILEGQPPVGYDQLVGQFNLQSPAQAANVLVTAKRMFARTLRAVIAEYTEDPEDVEQEIRELHLLLAGASP